MVLLDTDVMINFLRNEQNAVMMITYLKEKNEKIGTTSINEFELWKGAYIKKEKEGFEAVESLLSELEISLFDSHASKKAAEIFEKLKSGGEIIDALDILIASVAITNNESLLTMNEKHFKRISELNIWRTK